MRLLLSIPKGDLLQYRKQENCRDRKDNSDNPRAASQSENKKDDELS